MPANFYTGLTKTESQMSSLKTEDFLLRNSLTSYLGLKYLLFSSTPPGPSKSKCSITKIFLASSFSSCLGASFLTSEVFSFSLTSFRTIYPPPVRSIPQGWMGLLRGLPLKKKNIFTFYLSSY